MAVDGTRVAVRAESICCHGDTPGAVEIAAAVRSALERRRRQRGATVGFVIRPFGEAALLVEAGTPQRAQVLAAYLHTEPIEGVTEDRPWTGLRAHRDGSAPSGQRVH